MTRQEQNTIIINALQTELKDKPNVQDVIGQQYADWVRGLISQGNSMLAPTNTDASQAPAPEETQQ